MNSSQMNSNGYSLQYKHTHWARFLASGDRPEMFLPERTGTTPAVAQGTFPAALKRLEAARPTRQPTQLAGNTPRSIWIFQQRKGDAR
jgi:hypothetical protein